MPLYSHFPDANVDFTNDTIKCALLKTAYTPSQTGDQFFSGIVANETSGAGYTAGGTALSSKTVTLSGLTTIYDAADITWSTATFDCRYAVIYKDTGVAATSPLIGYAELLDQNGLPPSVSNGSLFVQFSVFGLYTKVVI